LKPPIIVEAHSFRSLFDRQSHLEKRAARQNREIYRGISAFYRKTISFCPKIAKLVFRTGKNRDLRSNPAKALTHNGFVPSGTHRRKINREGIRG
jgi:hypothetical protein